jgi:D-alanyl-D-alanine carboxypeptidase
VIDTSDSLVLWSRNETEELPIASLTKLMTAIVALDRLAPNQVATVSASDIGSPEESQMGLQAGDRVTVSELIRGLLIASGNDAANTLAHASGSWADFVSQMNDKATALGLTHTHFANPSGLDSEGHYSTVRDLAFLAEYALRYPLIRQSVGTAHYTAHSLSGKVFNLTTTNLLLDQGKVIGIKTGHTAAAGWCLIGLEPLHGREIMSVVLNSPDRFGETTNLFSWVDGHVK